MYLQCRYFVPVAIFRDTANPNAEDLETFKMMKTIPTIIDRVNNYLRVMTMVSAMSPEIFLPDGLDGSGKKSLSQKLNFWLV